MPLSLLWVGFVLFLLAAMIIMYVSLFVSLDKLAVMRFARKDSAGQFV